MRFDANGYPAFEEHDESVYDYEQEGALPPKPPHRLVVLGFSIGLWLVTLIAASVSVWIGVDLIAGHDISIREAVGGGWLVTAIGGYAGAKAAVENNTHAMRESEQ